MAKAHIYQLYADDAARDAIDPAFRPLALHGSERPDWREYGAMRKLLRETTLEAADFYGVLGPRFGPDTELTPDQVIEFVGLVGADYDVISFSPHPDQHALFWNVFEQADYQLPGNAMLCQEVLAELGFELDVTELVMDSRNSIFGNYFVAKPVFWAKWLDITGRLMALADGGGPLADRLNLPLPLRSGLSDPAMGQVKLLVMERVASLVLATSPSLKSIAYQPFMRPRTDSPFADFAVEAVLSDALKIAFNVRGDPIYRAAFGHIRDQVKAALDAKTAGG